MALPRQVALASASRPLRERRRWGPCLIGVAILLACGALCADDGAKTKPAANGNPFGVIENQPLSAKTWPLWREVYVRIFFDDDQDPDQERKFYEHVGTFFRTMAPAPGDTLPKDFADDGMAWVALAWGHLSGTGDDAPDDLARARNLAMAEAACRKAIALAGPQAIASYSLAAILIHRSEQARSAGDVTQRLAEAEATLKQVESLAPRANVKLWRGRIAELRGDQKGASVLLRQATEEHPKSSQAALAFLMNALQQAGPSDRVSGIAAPLAERFPRDPYIQAVYAMALQKDKRYPEAASAMRRARGIDEKVARFLGAETVKVIEEGEYLTPKVVGGLDALKSGQYFTADVAFREALRDEPRNRLAARFQARTIVERITSSRQRSIRTVAAAEAGQIADLCRRFPDDAELHAAHAVILHFIGRDGEAALALDRVERLGVSPEKFIDSAGVLEIRGAGATAESTDFWWTVALGSCVVAFLWIATMFAMGVVLAICIPRVPKMGGLAGFSRSRREVWLERFYLLVLSLGLVAFYASVPIVAVGVLAVTLALFGLLLVVRVIHIGVLHRGLWATWNVIRCAFLGPARGGFGIAASGENHPRLFETLRAVAGRLQTKPVDTVYLTPFSSISVHDEGSGPFGLFGRRQRVLEIGISTLPVLTRAEFEAILAHEYGHFTHRDTFYSRFIFQVSASLATSLAVMNAAGGILNYINPFYWFWWLYLRAYTLLATGFSRYREFLADRRATAAYGRNAFVSGLTKVAVDGALVSSAVCANVEHLLKQGKAFTNAFDAFRQYREGTEMVESRERLLEKMRQTKPKWFDTHPTFSERIAAVADFPDVEPTSETDFAIELLNEYQTVEAELTRLLTGHIHDMSDE
jgi:Zn-dependent protease with chaperone function/tetratricopeptide (TPR) repeat protein